MFFIEITKYFTYFFDTKIMAEPERTPMISAETRGPFCGVLALVGRTVTPRSEFSAHAAIPFGGR